MRSDIRDPAPLDWCQLVDEAIRRRKAEKLTQKEHAPLASVSIPMIVAFDRGEITLSLAKAFDILRVVGLSLSALAAIVWAPRVRLPRDSPHIRRRS